MQNSQVRRKLSTFLSHREVRNIKEARFPLKKHLVDFKRDKYDNEFLPKFEELETLGFITNKENIILIGTPGAGKTHYSIALGIAACMKGYSVLFASIPNLIVDLKETMNNNQFNSYRRHFERYDLVILDELGYVSLEKSGCEMLFNLISSRNDKGSILLTSTLLLTVGKRFSETLLFTGALITRLAHKAHILDILRELSTFATGGRQK